MQSVTLLEKRRKRRLEDGRRKEEEEKESKEEEKKEGEEEICEILKSKFLGTTSKYNRQVTSGFVWFRTVSFVKRCQLPRTAGQLAVGF